MADASAGDRQPAPSWPTCGLPTAGSGDCIGRQAEGFDRCLAHLDPDQLEEVLQRLSPGADLVAPGTTFEGALASRILSAVQVTGQPYHYRFGVVDLSRASFAHEAWFARAQFEGDARFDGAEFRRGARFHNAEFSGRALFDGAQFGDDAPFTGAQFAGDTSFRGAQFSGNTWFDGGRFAGSARFSNARFERPASFDGALFEWSASFDGAQFGYAGFEGAQVSGDAEFTGVRIGGLASFGGFRVSGDARFGGAQFSWDAKFGQAQFSDQAVFQDAQFEGDADFSGVRFSGSAHFPYEWCAHFGGAKFSGDAEFGGAQFSGDTTFRSVRFERSAGFSGAQFSGDAEYTWSHDFGGAQFSGNAGFGGAQFSGETEFAGAQFAGDTEFGGAQFSGIARFADARFGAATSFGPLAASDLVLQRAVFARPVVIEAAAVSLTCTDVIWQAGVTMRLRHATVDLERAAFTVPSSLVGADRPFELPGQDTRQLNESPIVSGRRPERGDALDDLWMPVLSSLRGVDAFNLSVTDVDLSQCRFAGARHLDQLRLEGRCVFDRPPEGLRAGRAWPPAWRWSRRQILAEERLWRAATPRYQGWAQARSGAPAEVRPERLAGLYRQLRKAQEDAKNEPGAADFYYGEMEMRRHARSSSRAERAIVWLYWLVSGYGLRALRSLAALLIVGVVVTAALTGWGFAGSAPSQHLTGTITTGPRDPAHIDAALHPAATRLPPASQRWTMRRAETALQITLESIAFRSTDQPLTPAGTWTTIAARILGPVLLALTLLAVRNRLKR
jgi:hypothetical protein